MTRSGITRGKVTAARTRGGRVLLDVTLLHGEVRSRVELLLPAGLTYIPPAGTDVLVLEVGGHRDHLVAVVADDAAQRIIGLGVGETGLRAHGQQVVIRRDGVEITNALKVTIVSAGTVTVQAGGTATVQAPAVVVDSPSVKLGSAGASKPVKLADNSNAAKVFAE